MFKRANIVLLTFLLFSFWNFSHAQENLEDSALNENKTEDYFYEAVAQRGIENYDKAIIAIKCGDAMDAYPLAFNLYFDGVWRRIEDGPGCLVFSINGDYQVATADYNVKDSQVISFNYVMRVAPNGQMLSLIHI